MLLLSAWYLKVSGAPRRNSQITYSAAWYGDHVLIKPFWVGLKCGAERRSGATGRL